MIRYVSCIRVPWQRLTQHSFNIPATTAGSCRMDVNEDRLMIATDRSVTAESIKLWQMCSSPIFCDYEGLRGSDYDVILRMRVLMSISKPSSNATGRMVKPNALPLNSYKELEEAG